MISNCALSWAWRLAAAAILGTLAVLPGSPASAHSELIESTPADGAKLTEAPTEVQLVFGETVQQQGGSIIVSVGDTVVSKSNTFATNENVASVQLAPGGKPGSYAVTFRVVSADGHVVNDTFGYTVVGDASTPTVTPTDTTGTPSDDQSTAAGATAPAEDSGDSAVSVVWVLGLGAIGIVLVAALIAVAVRGRRDRSD